MGNFCGCILDEDLQKKATENKQRYENKKINYIQKADIGFDIVTPPLLKENEIFLLSTIDGSTLYSIYDLNTSQFTSKAQEIKCDTKTFDISNTVYALNPNNNKIYFIENNKYVKVLDMKTEEIKSLNKSISTKNGNVATITYNNKNIYIIGAEDENEKHNEYIIIPYSTAKRTTHIHNFSFKEGVIHNFGSFSRLINVKHDDNDTNYVYIMGGESDGTPIDNIWIVKLLNDDGKHEWKMERNYELEGPIHSFGMINYQDMYLILFGGKEFRWRQQKVKESYYIYILPLTEQNPFKLSQHWWYKIDAKLPERGCFHALYLSNIVHLFSYNGKHYEIQIEDIFEKLRKGYYSKQRFWSERRGTAGIIESKSIKNMGPPISLLDEMLDELQQIDFMNWKKYEKYRQAFDDVDYYELDHIINDEDKMLETIITNQEHREIIIQKANFMNGFHNSNTIGHNINYLLKFVTKSHRLFVFGYVRHSQIVNIPHSIVNYCLLYSFVVISET